jgi:hypothetical protein
MANLLKVWQVLEILEAHDITSSEQMVRRFIRDGRLKAIKYTRRQLGYLVSEEEVFRFIDNCRPNSKLLSNIDVKIDSQLNKISEEILLNTALNDKDIKKLNHSLEEIRQLLTQIQGQITEQIGISNKQDDLKEKNIQQQLNLEDNSPASSYFGSKEIRELLEQSFLESVDCEPMIKEVKEYIDMKNTKILPQPDGKKLIITCEEVLSKPLKSKVPFLKAIIKDKYKDNEYLLK